MTGGQIKLYTRKIATALWCSIERRYTTMDDIWKPLVIGVSGVTNGGKTTLTEKLHKCLTKPMTLIKQDDYFYPEDSPKHIPSTGGIKHHNWEVISAIDMDTMLKKVKEEIHKMEMSFHDHLAEENTLTERGYRPTILLDGFILYDDPTIRELCSLKFFFTLPKHICKTRRMLRAYSPPDPPGYFDACVWPMYEEHLERIRKFPDIIFLDGDADYDSIVNQVKIAIKI